MESVEKLPAYQLQTLAAQIDQELDTTYDGLMADPPPWLVKLQDVLSRRRAVRRELKQRNLL